MADAVVPAAPAPAKPDLASRLDAVFGGLGSAPTWHLQQKPAPFKGGRDMSLPGGDSDEEEEEEAPDQLMAQHHLDELSERRPRPPGDEEDDDEEGGASKGPGTGSTRPGPESCGASNTAAFRRQFAAEQDEDAFDRLADPGWDPRYTGEERRPLGCTEIYEVNDEDDEDSTVLRVCSRLVPSRMETDVSSGADEEAAQQQEQAAIAVEARAARVRRSQLKRAHDEVLGVDPEEGEEEEEDKGEQGVDQGTAAASAVAQQQPVPEGEDGADAEEDGPHKRKQPRVAPGSSPGAAGSKPSSLKQAGAAPGATDSPGSNGGAGLSSTAGDTAGQGGGEGAEVPAPRRRGGKRVTWMEGVVQPGQQQGQQQPEEIGGGGGGDVQMADDSAGLTAGKASHHDKRTGGRAAGRGQESSHHQNNSQQHLQRQQQHGQGWNGRQQGRGGGRGRPPLLDWQRKGFVPDHVKHPERYTVYDLGEDLVVGGGDRSNNRGQSAGSGSLAGEAAELRRAAHAASAAAAASRTAVQGEDGDAPPHEREPLAFGAGAVQFRRRGKEGATSVDQAAAGAKPKPGGPASTQPRVALPLGDEDGGGQEAGDSGTAPQGTAAGGGSAGAAGTGGPAAKKARGPRNIRRTAAMDQDEQDA